MMSFILVSIFWYVAYIYINVHVSAKKAFIILIFTIYNNI